MRHWRGLLLACAALAGCTSMQPPPPIVSAAGAPAAIWYSPPADFPGICLTLAPGGELRFTGGFEFFNPGRWSLDNAAGELRIELGGTAPFPAEAAKDQLKRRPGKLLRIDAAHRGLVYGVTPATASIEFGGFVFYRKLACDNVPQQPR